MKYFFPIFTIFILLSCSNSKIELYVDGTNPEGWPYWRGVNNNGYIIDDSFTQNFSNDLEILWRVNIGQGFSAPSISGENVLVMGFEDGKDIVRCLDTLTGIEKWSASYLTDEVQYNGPRSTPAIEHGKVYTISARGKMVCFDLNSGEIIWSVDIPSEYGIRKPQYDFSSSIIIEGDKLLLNLGLYGMAFTKNGELVWKSPDAQSGYASPVVFEYKSKRVVAMQSGIGLYIVDIEDGSVIISYPWNAVNGADPLIFDEKVFLSSAYGLGCALIDISDVEPVQLWKNYSLNSHFATTYHLDGQIIGSDGETWLSRTSSLVSLDAETGEVIWRYENGISSFIFVNDTMLSLNYMGKLSFGKAVNNSYYENYATNEYLTGVCWTAPVFAYGIIFIRNWDGELIAVNARKK